MTLASTTEIPASDLQVGYTLIQQGREREVTRIEKGKYTMRMWLDGEKQSRRSYMLDDVVTVKTTDDEF